MISAIFLWIVLGSLVGWYSSSLIRSKSREPDTGINIALGINGAIAGGFIVNNISHDPVATNIYGLLLAGLCAMALIYSFRLLQK